MKTRTTDTATSVDTILAIDLGRYKSVACAYHPGTRSADFRTLDSRAEDFNRLLARYAARLVVYGHTHRALVHRAGDRSVLNPGAAGPRRFHLRPSVALVTLVGGQVEIEIRALE